MNPQCLRVMSSVNNPKRSDNPKVQHSFPCREPSDLKIPHLYMAPNNARTAWYLNYLTRRGAHYSQWEK